MLGKLLKHEFRATARWFLPAFGVVLILGVVGCGMGLINKSLPIWMIVLAWAIYALILTAFLILPTIVIIWRFYKNLLSNEGYLMFTLPVGTANLIWAKFIAATVWTVLSILMATLSALLIMLGIPGALSTAIRGLQEATWSGITPALVVAFALLLLAGLFSNPLSCYVSFAVGQLSNTYRIALAIGTYVGISIVLEIVMVVVGVIGGLTSSATGVIWSIVIVTWLFTIACFLVTQRLLTKRLNLV